jgi:branched-chain amino acid aminotransferase
MTSSTIAITRSVSPLPDDQREAILDNPGFGKYFTDHMVQIKWTVDRGWHEAELVPYGPITMDPATNSIHYGQSVFEGLKAYRRVDGSIATFRPLENARRFQRSAARLAMPALPEELFLAAIETLVTVDQEWVPDDIEKSLYLRPFMFSTEVGLGVRPANEYLFLLIASPAGAYFPGGVKPVDVWLSKEYVRAAPGGTGEAKCAGNYAASLLAQAQAIDNQCDQVA